MSGCIEYLNVRYCFVNSIFIVGDNVSCALVSNPQNGIIFIPYKINDTEVKELGAKSFSQCRTIEQVTIEARITQINKYAFLECEKLERINIPNTCKIIQPWGIQTYNATLGKSLPNPYKSLTIFFEANSKIKYIDTHGISYREDVNIYTCERINPILNSETFKGVTNLKIYSPASFVLNKTRSTTREFSSQCKRIISIQRKCSNKNTVSLFFYVLLLRI